MRDEDMELWSVNELDDWGSGSSGSTNGNSGPSGYGASSDSAYGSGGSNSHQSYTPNSSTSNNNTPMWGTDTPNSTYSQATPRSAPPVKERTSRFRDAAPAHAPINDDWGSLGDPYMPPASRGNPMAPPPPIPPQYPPKGDLWGADEKASKERIIDNSNIYMNWVAGTVLNVVHSTSSLATGEGAALIDRAVVLKTTPSVSTAGGCI